MAKGMPSVTALLALLAVAGYQNRDKISDMLRKASTSDRSAGDGDTATGLDVHNSQSIATVLSEIGSLFTGTSGPTALSGGLGGLIDRFRGQGHSETADSWIATGDNKPMAGHGLAAALGEDTLAELSAKTGLKRDTLLERLARVLPEACLLYTSRCV